MKQHPFPKGVALVILGALFLISYGAGHLIGAEARTGKTGKGLSLETATKKEVLAALSASIRESADSGPQMLTAVLTTRKELAAEAVQTAIEAALPAGCDRVSAIASAAVAADPDQAASILEMSSMLAPSCRTALEHSAAARAGAAESEDTVTAAAAKSGGGSVDRRKRRCAVCHNGHTVLLKCGKQVDKFLKHHPGDFFGSCEATPIENE
jgi:hypothetical protein